MKKGKPDGTTRKGAEGEKVKSAPEVTTTKASRANEYLVQVQRRAAARGVRITLPKNPATYKLPKPAVLKGKPLSTTVRENRGKT